CATALTVQMTPAAEATKKKPAAEPKAAETKAAPAAKPASILPETVAVVEGAEIKRAEVEKALNDALAQQGGNASVVPDAQKLEFYRNVVNGFVIEKLVQTRSELLEVPDKEVDENFAKLKAPFPTEDAMN